METSSIEGPPRSITLYLDGYFVNPLDAICLVALTEKGVEFQTARALLRDGQGVPPALGSSTIIPRVPALQHGDFFLTESLAIVDYIEEAFPAPWHPSLFPADPRTRARAHQIMAYVRFDLGMLRYERPWWTVAYPVAASQRSPLSATARHQADELIAVATRVVPELGEWSIAHADLALQLLRLARNDEPVPDSLRRFLEHELARPSVRAYIDHARPPNPPPRAVGIG
jgi:glutathione S-transferase